MTLQELITKLNLTVLTTPRDFSAVIPQGGYASDLLSCVIAGAEAGNIWVTLQAHMNVVAVAALRDVSVVILTENAQPEAEVIEKANQQDVILLATSEPSYEVVGKLWELGIR
ncbi:MAG: serine kinase [Anaerolineales bacterium]|nr:serine kinase [Anaerolineales bacterium]